MDHHFHQPSKGSAILAYGVAPKGRGLWKWLLIGLLSILIITFGGGWLLSQTLTVKLPSQRLLLVALKPSQIKLPSTLVTDLPDAWRAALRTETNLPILMGVRMQDTGYPQAFALVYRHHLVVPTDHMTVRKQGIYKLLLDHPVEVEMERLRLATIFQLQRRLRNHQASWRLESQPFVAATLGTEEVNESIFGTWNGGQGTIQLPGTGIQNVLDDGSPMIVTLGADRDEALPAIQALTSQGFEPPQRMTPFNVAYLTPSTTSLSLGWEENPSQVEQRQIFGAFGITSLQEYTLPDETIVREFRPTDQLLTSVSGSLISQDGQRGIRHLDADQGSCPGALRLLLDQELLNPIFEQWQVPPSWQEWIKEVQIKEGHAESRICISTNAS